VRIEPSPPLREALVVPAAVSDTTPLAPRTEDRNATGVEGERSGRGTAAHAEARPSPADVFQWPSGWPMWDEGEGSWMTGVSCLDKRDDGQKSPPRPPPPAAEGTLSVHGSHVTPGDGPGTPLTAVSGQQVVTM